MTIDTEQRGRPADPDNPQRLLAALASAAAPASFFIQGRWAGACPELARQIAVGGHLIGNHSYYHVPMNLLTDEGIRNSIRRAEEAIFAATGVDPRPWFRCPYGEGDDDARVLALLAELGYRNTSWDFETDDWRTGRDATALIETVLQGCREHGDGARVLLHSWPDVTAAALPEMIVRLRTAGADLVRLDGFAA